VMGTLIRSAKPAKAVIIRSSFFFSLHPGDPSQARDRASIRGVPPQPPLHKPLITLNDNKS
jgi:hypothetical protein